MDGHGGRAGPAAESPVVAKRDIFFFPRFPFLGTMDEIAARWRFTDIRAPIEGPRSKNAGENVLRLFPGPGHAEGDGDAGSRRSRS